MSITPEELQREEQLLTEITTNIQNVHRYTSEMTKIQTEINKATDRLNDWQRAMHTQQSMVGNARDKLRAFYKEIEQHELEQSLKSNGLSTVSEEPVRLDREVF